MTTPILRNNIGSPIAVTTANAIANNAYANSADALHIDNTTSLALLADFTLSGATFGAAPVTGRVQLIAVDRNTVGTIGPTPSASMLGRVYPFDPKPAASNALTTWTMTCPKVPLNADTDYWLYNNATGQSIAAGCVLSAQLWSPGA